MKKQRFFMLGIITVLVAVLSLTFVSSTFAKYTTNGTAEDTARVAKWGVTVTVSGDDAFAVKYDDAASDTGTKVVSSTTDNVVAPGTNGTLGSISIAGTPEVMVNVTVNFDLTLSDWPGNNCPIVFTIGSTNYKIDGSTINTVAELEQAVENAVKALSAENVAANTGLARSITVAWSWAYESGNDANDTALGNQAVSGTAPTIAAEWEVIVTQVD